MKRLVIDIETAVAPQFENSPQSDESKRRGLDALQAQVVCVGVLLIDDYDLCSANAFVGSDERWILERFWNFLSANRVFKFVSHNGLSFDLPFLWRRSIVNRLRPTIDLDLRRYRTDPVYDTMAVWANWEMRSSPSLDSLARGLGVGQKSGSGDDIAQLFSTGTLDQIASYCLHDCWLTYACFCRMNFEEPMRANAVKAVVDVSNIEPGSALIDPAKQRALPPAPVM